jgi:hypothetical protein
MLKENGESEIIDLSKLNLWQDENELINLGS